MRPRNGAKNNRLQAQHRGKVLKTTYYKGDRSCEGINADYHNNQAFKQIQKPCGAQRVFDLHQHYNKHAEETNDGYDGCGDHQIHFILRHPKHNENQIQNGGNKDGKTNGMFFVMKQRVENFSHTITPFPHYSGGGVEKATLFCKLYRTK